jgi:hypothetical protein
MDSIKSKLQQEINKIYQENGNVRPSVLIERAKSKTSPIHDAFEWDNKKAGHEYRLIQARRYIRVAVPDIKQAEVQDRFVHIPRIAIGDTSGEREGYYKPISILTKGSDEYELAHHYLLSRLNAAKEAYHEFKKVAERKGDDQQKMFENIDMGFRMIEDAIPKRRSM